jgi:anthraniloyl-CoA monooxygenase
MRAVSIGGGPAGLFFAILLKRLDPSHQVTVYERNRLDDTFGFGVVFSDATLDGLERAEPETLRRVRAAFHHWDDIDIFRGAEHVRSRGHGFAGVSRRGMLQILTARALELGVDVRHHAELVDPESVRDADLVLVADGVSSGVRNRYAQHFGPQIDWRPNRFAWLGTTMPLDAFTFYFDEDAHGLWRVHAYQYEPGQSTFIVEATGDTWARTGLPEADDAATVAFCERLFAHRLQGHKLVANRSLWRRFPNIRNTRWCHENVVLVGDAAHTAHFSIGSGTKLAMEDAIEPRRRPRRAPERRAASARRLRGRAQGRWWRASSAPRRPAWSGSRRWSATADPMPLFDREPADALHAHHARNLGRAIRPSSPSVRRASSSARAAQSGGRWTRSTPPMFAPFKLRSGWCCPTGWWCRRCVSTRAVDGVPNDSGTSCTSAPRAQGGAGLVMTEMTDVSRRGAHHPGLHGPLQRRPTRRVEATSSSFVHDNTAARRSGCSSGTRGVRARRASPSRRATTCPSRPMRGRGRPSRRAPSPGPTGTPRRAP